MKVGLRTQYMFKPHRSGYHSNGCGQKFDIDKNNTILYNNLVFQRETFCTLTQDTATAPVDPTYYSEIRACQCVSTSSSFILYTVRQALPTLEGGFPVKGILIIVLLMVVVILAVIVILRRKGGSSEDRARQSYRSPSGATSGAPSGGVRARDPQGRTVYVDNTRYIPVPVPTGAAPHYYGGGMYGGYYYAPGYYSDPFWNYVMMDAIIDENQEAFEEHEEQNFDDQGNGYGDDTSYAGVPDGSSWGSDYGYDPSNDSGSSSSDAGGSDWSGGGGGSFSSGDSGGGYSSGDSGGSFSSGDSGGGGW